VRLVAALKDLDGLTGKAGWLENERYEDGTPVAYVAAIQELGNGPIPPRPFMRNTTSEKGKAWMDLFGLGAVEVLDGRLTAPQALEAVVLRAAGDIAITISKVTAPPLSPLTLLARRQAGPNKRLSGAGELGPLGDELDRGPPDVSGVSTKPLIWTGLLFQSVTGAVERKGSRLFLARASKATP